jgi:energy-coupling factor transporter ATP-binding protein EcfA2
MQFPIKLDSIISIEGEEIQRTIFLHGGLTVLIGPNGSGKTHLMRGLKQTLAAHCPGKKVRFLSAGRIGMLEQYRSDYDGHRGNSPNYHNANYGSLDDTKRRHQFETLQGDFQTLAVRPDILIKVRERLRKLFGRDISVLWNAGSIKVEFVRTSGTTKPYTSGREASGLMHLAGLLSALYDDEVGALLIDEPEVSLHPQLQAFLLKEILGVAGLPSESPHKKLVVIGTHSTEFIRVEAPPDLAKLVFCYDLTAEPIQVPPDAEELKSAKIFSLISRMGQEHKLSFFAKSPLLVEGPSDAIICVVLTP